MKIYDLMDENKPENYVTLAYKTNLKELEDLAKLLADGLNLAIVQITSNAIYALVLVYAVEVRYGK